MLLQDLTVFSAAGGAADSERRGSEPGAAEDPEGDRVQEDPGARIRSLRDRLQGEQL